MDWWAWMVLGAILLGAELFAVEAQFYLVFLGVSAALVGLGGLMGIDLPGWAQYGVFAILSLFFFFTFRRTLYNKLHSGTTDYRETLSGDTLTVGASLAPGSEARAEHRGTKWTVRNVGDTEIGAGKRAKVIRAEGLTLHVEAD